MYVCMSLLSRPPLLIVQWGRESFEQFDYDYLLATERSANKVPTA